MSGKIVPTPPKNARKMPLLSQETAKKQYDRLYNSHHTDTGGLASKVVTFQHNMENEILYEVTGLRNFFDKYDPRDKNVKPYSAKRVIEKGQLGWLYSNIQKIDFRTGIVKRGFIPRIYIVEIQNLKLWRNIGEHEDIMPWDKYLTHLGTMARTISFFSGTPIPRKINNILNNQMLTNSSNSANRKNPKSKQKSNDKPSTNKSAVRKTVTKKPAANKPAVKKPTVKKPLAKKPAVKTSNKAKSKKKATSKLTASSSKPAAKRTTTKKSVVKKPIAKKPAVKKPMVKKPLAKKPVRKTSNKAKPKKRTTSILAASSSKPAAKRSTTKKSMVKKSTAKKPVVKKSTANQEKQEKKGTSIFKKLRDILLGK